MDAKMPPVNILRPGCLVCEQLAIKRRLGQRLAFDRHGSPVCFKEEISPLALAGGIRVFQGKNAVRDDTELQAALNLHLPLERLPFGTDRKVVFIKELDAAMVLQTRGGRLSADIQAVVAADYMEALVPLN